MLLNQQDSTAHPNSLRHSHQTHHCRRHCSHQQQQQSLGCDPYPRMACSVMHIISVMRIIPLCFHYIKYVHSTTYNSIFSDCFFSGSCRSWSSESQQARCNSKDCWWSGRSISSSHAFLLAGLYQESVWLSGSRRCILRRSGYFGCGGQWLLMFSFPSHRGERFLQ